MLPFLKEKKVAGLILSKRKPDGSVSEEHSDDDKDHGLEAAAEDLIRALSSKDISSVAAALRAAFQILDAEPHEEGEHTNDESYDSQNIKAAQ